MTEQLRQVELISAFKSLDAPACSLIVQPRHRARLLPRHCGTYALYDRAGKLLYIGKAGNVRHRVYSHLRNEECENLLPSWTHLIGWIEVRCTQTEAESLLVEADLVSRLLPPCNRDLRRWSEYCYLAPTGELTRPLIMTQQPVQGCSFGPYRSCAQAVRILETVRSLVQGSNLEILHRCYGLLSGEDASLLEALTVDAVQPDEPGEVSRANSSSSEVLLHAFQRGALLRQARSLYGGMIMLPALKSDRVHVLIIGPTQLHILELDATAESASRALLQYHALIGKHETPVALPKRQVDALCLGVREAALNPRKCRLLSKDDAMTIRAEGLMSLGESLTQA